MSWLHLTDLHVGQSDDGWLWPLASELFKEDLRQLHKVTGPWDLVLFTGDLSQSGSSAEFDRLASILSDLWTFLDQLGSHPRLLAIPGNHDLSWPDKGAPAVEVLRDWAAKAHLHDAFLLNNTSPYREVVDAAFLNYSRWWETSAHRPPGLVPGLLPGEYSTTFTAGDLRIGVLALNSAYAQLSEGDYQGRLEFHPRQFHGACHGDGPRWAQSHDVCVLLTHHPPSWLSPQARQHFDEDLCSRGRFGIHFCGHEHANSLTTSAVGATLPRRTWQARSLCGLTKHGDQTERRFGYAAGTISLRRGALFVRQWPRICIRRPGSGWQFVPDTQSAELLHDGGTEPERLAAYRGRVASTKSSTRAVPHRRDMQPSGDVPPPFDVARLRYDLPQPPSLTMPLVPIPARLNGVAAPDALALLAAEISDHFRAQEAADVAAAYDTWEKALKRSKRPKEKKTAAKLFEEMLPGALSLCRLPTPLFLLLGDTGTGKSTVARELARVFGALVDLQASTPQTLESDVTSASSSVPPHESGWRSILVLDALDKLMPAATNRDTLEHLRLLRRHSPSFGALVITARTQFFRDVSSAARYGDRIVYLEPLTEESTLALAHQRGAEVLVRDLLAPSSSVRDLAQIPLLLTLLCDIASRGESLAGLDDHEHLYSLIIEPWLLRDDPDSTVSRQDRLVCMQALALHALASGGEPIRYGDINHYARELLRESSTNLEGLNKDLRVCGFLAADSPDAFRFQHASFYEYCIARTVFDDLGNNELRAIGSHPFTPEIIAFLDARIRRLGAIESIAAAVRRAWDTDLGGVARINLLRLCWKLSVDVSDLSLTRLVLRHQALHGLRFPSSVDDVTFEDCTLFGITWKRSTAKRVTFLKCQIRDGYIEKSSIEMGQIIDSDIALGGMSSVTFTSCNWSRSELRLSDGARCDLRGGSMHQCAIGTSGAAFRGLLDIRNTHMIEVQAKGSLNRTTLSDCSVDGLTLYFLSQLKGVDSPTMSKDIKDGVAQWRKGDDPPSGVTAPEVQASDPNADPLRRGPMVSKTQQRKINRMRARMGQIGKQKPSGGQ